jgi:polyferredoxin
MKKKIKYRFISQMFFFLTVSFIALNHYLAEIGKSIPFIGDMSLHAICPFGAVESFMALFQYNVLISKIHESSFIIFILIAILSVLFGPVVCSYICPLGTIQEWIGKVGKKLFNKRYNTFIPQKLDKILRYARYGVLIFVVYLSTQSLKLVFLEVDPYFALFNFWSDEVTIGGLIVLAVIIISSLFIERPWCKYACPFGALVGLSNFISIFKIRRNQHTCISCNACTKACPMNIDVANKTHVLDHQCISCGICTSDDKCPVPKTVEMKVAKYKEVSDDK